MRLLAPLTRSTSRKLLTSLGAVGVAAGVAGLGSFAAFTSSTSASQNVSTGTVTAALGAAGGVDNRLTVGASGIAAGDSIQRVVKLSNTGSLGWASANLSTSATTSSLLNTDATNGLQLVVDKCSVAWTEASTVLNVAPFTYTCSGTTTTVIASRAVIGANMPLGSLASLSPNSSDHLRVTLTLPTAADNTFQNLSSTIAFNFIATQRTAASA